MKKFIFALFSIAALLVSCTDDDTISGLDILSVDKTIVSISENGGSETVTINAKAPWNIVEDAIPSNLTVSPLSGGAGETKVTFSSPGVKKAIKGVNIEILCDGQSQYLIYQQQADPSMASPYPEFKAGKYWIMFKKEDGKWLSSKHATCGIDNNSYTYISCSDTEGDLPNLTGAKEHVFTFESTTGGFFIKDTEDAYLYMDGDGKYNNFYRTADKSKAMVWTVEQTSDTEYEITSSQGKWIQYSTGYSTWGAYNSKQEKALLPYLVPAKELSIALAESQVTIPKEANTFTVPAEINADEVSVNYDVDWLQYLGTTSEGLKFKAAENTGGARNAKVNITSSLQGKNITNATLEINQEGSIQEVTVEQFLAAEVGDALYKITGRVTNRTDISGHKFDLDTYGNFDLVDATGNVYIYGVMTPEMVSKQFGTLGVKEGDIITVIGKRAEYKDAPQMGSAYYVSHTPVTKIDAASFNALKDDANTWYELTGTVTDGTAQAGHKFDLATYGNFDLIDATGDVYVYGLTTGWGGPSKSAGNLGLKAGDVITIVAHKTSYKDAPQAGSAWFVSKAE